MRRSERQHADLESPKPVSHRMTRAAFAAVLAGALVALGVPTASLADETPPAVDSQQLEAAPASESTGEGAGENAAPPPEPEPAPLAEEAPGEVPPAEEPPAEEPVIEDEPVVEAPEVQPQAKQAAKQAESKPEAEEPKLTREQCEAIGDPVTEEGSEERAACFAALEAQEAAANGLMMPFSVPGFDPQTDNPTLNPQCGLDIALVLDRSGSIGNTGMGQLKAAADGLVDALVNTGSYVSVASFADNGTVNLDATAITSANLATIKGSYAGLTSNGWTNWEGGLSASQGTFADFPDAVELVVFITDGNPNTTNTSSGGQYADGSPQAVNPAIAIANGMKGSGTHILGLAVGSISPTPIQAISSTTGYDGSNFPDAGYMLAANYAAVQGALEAISTELCGGNVVVHKQYGENWDATTPGGAGWEFTTSSEDVEPSVGVTDDTSATPAFDVEGYGVADERTVTFTESEWTEGPEQFTDLIGVKCGPTEATATEVTLDGRSWDVVVPKLELVHCWALNTPPYDLEIDKNVVSTTETDGLWTIDYTIDVTNAGDYDLPPQGYSLSDEVAFGPGILVQSIEYWTPGQDPNVDPGTPVDPDDGTFVLGSGIPLAAGAPPDTWHVRVTATLEGSWDPANGCENEPQGGFVNTGTVTLGTAEWSDTACDEPRDVGIVKTFGPEGVVVDDGVEFWWEFTVTNRSSLAATGVSVSDQLSDSVVYDPLQPIVIESTDVDPADWTAAVDPDNLFTASFAGDYPGGAVTTFRVPVTYVGDPPMPIPENPSDEQPVLPAEELANEACVESELDGNPENDCSETTVPTKAINANAYVQCEADVPWLYYDVQATDSVEAGEITVTWTPDPAVYPDAEPIVDTIQWDERSGRVLWPYAAVNEQGIGIGWPGWRLAVEGDDDNPNIVDRWENMVKDVTLPSYAYADLVNPLEIEFVVNPSQTVLATYPQATPACEVQRDANVQIEKTASVQNVKPGGSLQYTIAVWNPGLGAASPVELFDEIPADIRVDAIHTDAAPAYPRWEDCAVTETDSAGYGGVLHCTLNGAIGGTQPNAPDVVLDVTLHPSTGESRIDNTGEVCWNEYNPSGPPPGEGEGTADLQALLDENQPIYCAESTATVTVLHPGSSPAGLARTGFDGTAWLWLGGVLLLLGGAIASVVRRRREI